MSDLEPITRQEKLWSGEDIEPITREEMYIKHIFDKTQPIPSEPLTRKEMLLEKAGEGGGSDVDIKQLSVTENGTYFEEGTAYSPVLVQVNAGGAVNPNYEWWANEDRTIVVRRKLFNSNNQYYRIQDAPYRIYFNWFDINTTSAPFQALMNPPFITANEGGQGNFTMFVRANTQVYAECDQTDYGGASDTHGYIGFYNDTIRGWTTGLEANQVGKYRAIIESTDRGQVSNPTPWEEPTFDPING